MNVKCHNKMCYACSKDMVCTLDAIELDEDGCCESYNDYTDVGQNYQNKFYKHMKSKKDGHGCKKECFGKKIERFGMVFYTTDDDRYDPDGVGLTEEKSGYFVGLLSDLTEERCEEIKRRMSDIVPVADEPDCDPWEDL